MNTLNIYTERLLEECPFVKDWIDTISKEVIKKQIKYEDVISYYSYGSFVKKSENNTDTIISSFEDSLSLKYEDRLRYELSKIRVDVIIKMGSCIFSNRLPKDFIPQTIKDLVTEITKVRMNLECEDHGNMEIKNTIPPYSDDIKIELMDNDGDNYEKSYDVDDILDKILKHGYDSLTKEERSFLDKKSKDD